MYEFNTPEPVRLRIEFEAGDIQIETANTTSTQVELVSGRDDDAGRDAVAQTKIEQHGKDIVIETPRRAGGGFFRRSLDLRLRVVVPQGSSLEAKIQSADLTVRGVMADLKTSSGSGDVTVEAVTGDTRIQTGSGDVRVHSAGDTTKVQAGSGDVTIENTGGRLLAATGSGDIEVGNASGDVHANAGSGDIHVQRAEGSVSVNSGSGDLNIGWIARGSLKANSASGDVHVGIADGTAAWLDVNSLSGTVHSSLDGTDSPADEEETVEVRVTTVSGDVALTRA